jgi:hypothetical protein
VIPVTRTVRVQVDEAASVTPERLINLVAGSAVTVRPLRPSLGALGVEPRCRLREQRCRVPPRRRWFPGR